MHQIINTIFKSDINASSKAVLKFNISYRILLKNIIFRIFLKYNNITHDYKMVSESSVQASPEQI